MLNQNIKDATTVLLLRDHPDHRIEVYMLQRYPQAKVLGGMYVFPGGKLDTQDLDARWENFLDTHLDELYVALGSAGISKKLSMAIYVSAFRELFEECKVLLCKNTFSNLESRDLWASMKNGSPILQLMQSHSVLVDTKNLHPWKRWITPESSPLINQRFDTRFFISKYECSEDPEVDVDESVLGKWLSTVQAIEEYEKGNIQLAPPQIMSLIELSQYKSVTEVLQNVEKNIPTILPVIEKNEDGILQIYYPGDVKHPIQQKAMSGPTRMQLINNKFQPITGRITELLLK